MSFEVFLSGIWKTIGADAQNTMTPFLALVYQADKANSTVIKTTEASIVNLLQSADQTSGWRKKINKKNLYDSQFWRCRNLPFF